MLSSQSNAVAGEGQVMLRWGSGSSKLYYVLAGSTGGCCFCPMGANSVAWRASSPLGPFSLVGNINSCLEDCHAVDGQCTVCCPGSQGCPRSTPAPPAHTEAVGQISSALHVKGGARACLEANTSAACVPHGHELPPTPAGSGSQCPVRIEVCRNDSPGQQWRIMSNGELVSNATGSCMDAAHGEAGGGVYTNFCVRTKSDPKPIGQTWNATAYATCPRASDVGELQLIASDTCVALGSVASSARMAACGHEGSTQYVWSFPQHESGDTPEVLSTDLRTETPDLGVEPLPPEWLTTAWTVAGQQQGIIAMPHSMDRPVGLPAACEGGIMMWSGDAWQHAPDGQKEHDPQVWVPLCFDARGNILNLTMLTRWNVTVVSP